MVDAHFLYGRTRKRAVDDACIHSGLLEYIAILQYAGDTSTTIRSSPGVDSEFVRRIEGFEFRDYFLLLGFDEGFHSQAHGGGGCYARFSLCKGVSVGDGGGLKLEGRGELTYIVSLGL